MFWRFNIKRLLTCMYYSHGQNKVCVNRVWVVIVQVPTTVKYTLVCNNVPYNLGEWFQKKLVLKRRGRLERCITFNLTFCTSASFILYIYTRRRRLQSGASSYSIYKVFVEKIVDVFFPLLPSPLFFFETSFTIFTHIQAGNPVPIIEQLKSHLKMLTEKTAKVRKSCDMNVGQQLTWQLTQSTYRYL